MSVDPRSTNAIDLSEQLSDILEEYKDVLSRVNDRIHSRPELSFEEFYAHDTICDALSELGYKVTRHAYGLQTAFQAEYGEGGAVVAYNAEYDALPEIGHACGHNLIATSSLAAFIGTARVLAAVGGPGRVRILGTPAEEGGGGKIDLIEAGAYKDVDACLMGHPGPKAPGKPWDCVVLPRCMAKVGISVTFKGASAHAGYAPWLGMNALDAAVAAYTSIAMLRQQTPPNERIHAIIDKGGDRVNIIPHISEMTIFNRAESAADAEKTLTKTLGCVEGAAKATGCEIEIKKHHMYKDLQCSKTISLCFEKFAKTQGQTCMRYAESVCGASTDQGNVSYEVPSIHPEFGIPVGHTDIGPHQPAFEQAAGQPSAFQAALGFAKAMAATGIEILRNEKMREEMWAEHHLQFK